MDNTTGKSAPATLSVTALNALVKQSLEGWFSNIWVEGEVSDIARPHSGHVYFTLKDEQSRVRAVVWRTVAASLPFALEDGQSVLCNGSIDVYLARGTYQIIVRRIEAQGVGNLQVALRQLRDRLAGEGLFDADRKKPLPKIPKRIGMITSPTSAAVRDFLEVCLRRWPRSQVLIIPTPVQGAAAAQNIIASIQAAHQVSPNLDVLVIGRGGGSLEDLACFNDEAVVRAIAAAKIPTLTAIGHEIDITLADLASDRRALTPTEAGELVVPSHDDVTESISTARRQLDGMLRRLLKGARQQISDLSQSPAIQMPHRRLFESQRIVDERECVARDAIFRVLQNSRTQLMSTAAIMDALSPLHVMARGFSITRKARTAKILRTIDDATIGDLLETQLRDGVITSRVDQIRDAQRHGSAE